MTDKKLIDAMSGIRPAKIAESSYKGDLCDVFRAQSIVNEYASMVTDTKSASFYISSRKNKLAKCVEEWKNSKNGSFSFCNVARTVFVSPEDNIALRFNNWLERVTPIFYDHLMPGSKDITQLWFDNNTSIINIFLYNICPCMNDYIDLWLEKNMSVNEK